MIPDKIYFDIQDLGSGYVYSISLDNNHGEQEYIRKDALIEWAKKQRIPTEQCKLAMDIGWAAAFEELIDKLNSI